MKVRLMSCFPLSIVKGGYEHQFINTVEALRERALDVDFFNWHDEFDCDSILHIFGATPGWGYVSPYINKSRKVVVSALAGARGRHLLYNFFGKSISVLSKFVSQKNSYAYARDILERANVVICLNNFEKTYFVHTYSLPESKIVVVPNGIGNFHFSSTGVDFRESYGLDEYVLFVGNLTERKNPLLLASVLEELGIPGVFIAPIFSSESLYGKRFQEIISRNDSLLWVKGLDYSDPLLVSAYAHAKVFCLPSRSETQPLAAMEAMATGTPLVLSDLPYAYQEPFNKSLKVKVDSRADLINKIMMAYNSPQDFSHKLSPHYTWQNVASEVAKIYNTL